MRRSRGSWLAWVALVAVTPACGDKLAPDEPPACTVTAPTECADPAPHYPDVAPIIESRCASCHSGSGGEWPLDTYSHVAGWWDLIRDEVRTCQMPPPDSGITMPDDERAAVLMWIRCGFPE